MARPTTSLDYYATLARAPHHDGDALTGGTWVNDRGVMRWVECEPIVHDPIEPYAGACIDCAAELRAIAKRCAPCAREAMRRSWRESKRRRAAA